MGIRDGCGLAADVQDDGKLYVEALRLRVLGGRVEEPVQPLEQG